MSIPLNLESTRMHFRLLNMDDIDVVYRQFSDLDMCSFFSEPPCTLNESKEIIEHYQEPEGKGYLRYGMFHKKTGEFIGTCGFHYLDKKLKQVELGYDIWKEHWKQGYATEALEQLIPLCFNYLEVECIYILTHPSNTGSIACVKKFYFTESDLCRNTEDDVICMKLLYKDWITENLINN